MLRDNPDVVIMLAGLLLVFAYFMVVWSKVGRSGEGHHHSAIRNAAGLRPPPAAISP